ncbi:hypothetical protein OF83DRAFT_452638 [Amylostereum chailletii]|nr:hypothetical protein OF83DRAFT_452638 [Amylostereum chailletii]
MASQLYPWVYNVTAPARDIVRNVIRTSSTPLSTKNIFKQAVKQVPSSTSPAPTKAMLKRMSGPLPSHPEHPVRSISYLKHIVLPELVKRKEIELVHTQRTLTQEEINARMASMTKAQRARAGTLSATISSWVWQARDYQPQPVVQKEEVVTFGTEVGVGEDWGHLNRRRRRARETKVKRDVKWMRKLIRAKDSTAEEATASS